MSDRAVIIGIVSRLLEDLAELIAAAPEEAKGAEAGHISGASPLMDRGWLNIDEASRWTGFSRKHLNRLRRQRRLWAQVFSARDIRIPRLHLDEQMARGFPPLDMAPDPEDIADAAARMRRLIPGPAVKLGPPDPNPPRVK